MHAFKGYGLATLLNSIRSADGIAIIQLNNVKHRMSSDYFTVVHMAASRLQS